MKRGFAPIIVLIIAAIVAIGIGGYLTFVQQEEPVLPAEEVIQPAVDETADWEAYRNQEFGYELNYPKDWFIKDVTVDPTDEFKLAESIIIFNSKPIDDGRMAMHLDPEGLMIRITKKSSNYQKPEDNSGFDSFAINNILYERFKQDFGSIYSIEIVRDDLLYTFSYHFQGSDVLAIDKILSTFKFIE